ncbi:unnamed protein product [Closterium sp. NIES-65]|nr:unnamed protein product [Closterium sp. NIES-65]
MRPDQAAIAAGALIPTTPAHELGSAGDVADGCATNCVAQSPQTTTNDDAGDVAAGAEDLRAGKSTCVAAVAAKDTGDACDESASEGTMSTRVDDDAANPTAGTCMHARAPAADMEVAAWGSAGEMAAQEADLGLRGTGRRGSSSGLGCPFSAPPHLPPFPLPPTSLPPPSPLPPPSLPPPSSLLVPCRPVSPRFSLSLVPPTPLLLDRSPFILPPSNASIPLPLPHHITSIPLPLPHHIPSPPSAPSPPSPAPVSLVLASLGTSVPPCLPSPLISSFLALPFRPSPPLLPPLTFPPLLPPLTFPPLLPPLTFPPLLPPLTSPPLLPPLTSPPLLPPLTSPPLLLPLTSPPLLPPLTFPPLLSLSRLSPSPCLFPPRVLLAPFHLVVLASSRLVCCSNPDLHRVPALLQDLLHVHAALSNACTSGTRVWVQPEFAGAAAADGGGGGGGGDATDVGAAENRDGDSGKKGDGSGDDNGDGDEAQDPNTTDAAAPAPATATTTAAAAAGGMSNSSNGGIAMEVIYESPHKENQAQAQGKTSEEGQEEETLQAGPGRRPEDMGILEDGDLKAMDMTMRGTAYEAQQELKLYGDMRMEVREVVQVEMHEEVREEVRHQATSCAPPALFPMPSRHPVPALPTATTAATATTVTAITNATAPAPAAVPATATARTGTSSIHLRRSASLPCLPPMQPPSTLTSTLAFPRTTSSSLGSCSPEPSVKAGPEAVTPGSAEEPLQRKRRPPVERIALLEGSPVKSPRRRLFLLERRTAAAAAASAAAAAAAAPAVPPPSPAPAAAAAAAAAATAAVAAPAAPTAAAVAGAQREGLTGVRGEGLEYGTAKCSASSGFQSARTASGSGGVTPSSLTQSVTHSGGGGGGGVSAMMSGSLLKATAALSMAVSTAASGTAAASAFAAAAVPSPLASTPVSRLSIGSMGGGGGGGAGGGSMYPVLKASSAAAAADTLAAGVFGTIQRTSTIATAPLASPAAAAAAAAAASPFTTTVRSASAAAAAGGGGAAAAAAAAVPLTPGSPATLSRRPKLAPNSRRSRPSLRVEIPPVRWANLGPPPLPPAALPPPLRQVVSAEPGKAEGGEGGGERGEGSGRGGESRGEVMRRRVKARTPGGSLFRGVSSGIDGDLWLRPHKEGEEGEVGEELGGEEEEGEEGEEEGRRGKGEGMDVEAALASVEASLRERGVVGGWGGGEGGGDGGGKEAQGGSRMRSVDERSADEGSAEVGAGQSILTPRVAPPTVLPSPPALTAAPGSAAAGTAAAAAAAALTAALSLHGTGGEECSGLISSMALLSPSSFLLSPSFGTHYPLSPVHFLGGSRRFPPTDSHYPFGSSPPSASA